MSGQASGAGGVTAIDTERLRILAQQSEHLFRRATELHGGGSSASTSDLGAVLARNAGADGLQTGWAALLEKSLSAASGGGGVSSDLMSKAQQLLAGSAYNPQEASRELGQLRLRSSREVSSNQGAGAVLSSISGSAGLIPFEGKADVKAFLADVHAAVRTATLAESATTAIAHLQARMTEAQLSEWERAKEELMSSLGLVVPLAAAAAERQQQQQEQAQGQEQAASGTTTALQQQRNPVPSPSEFGLGWGDAKAQASQQGNASNAYDPVAVSYYQQGIPALAAIAASAASSASAGASSALVVSPSQVLSGAVASAGESETSARALLWLALRLVAREDTLTATSSASNNGGAAGIVGAYADSFRSKPLDVAARLTAQVNESISNAAASGQLDTGATGAGVGVGGGLGAMQRLMAAKQGRQQQPQQQQAGAVKLEALLPRLEDEVTMRKDLRLQWANGAVEHLALSFRLQMASWAAEHPLSASIDAAAATANGGANNNNGGDIDIDPIRALVAKIVDIKAASEGMGAPWLANALRRGLVTPSRAGAGVDNDVAVPFMDEQEDGTVVARATGGRALFPQLYYLLRCGSYVQALEALQDSLTVIERGVEVGEGHLRGFVSNYSAAGTAAATDDDLEAALAAVFSSANASTANQQTAAVIQKAKALQAYSRELRASHALVGSMYTCLAAYIAVRRAADAANPSVSAATGDCRLQAERQALELVKGSGELLEASARLATAFSGARLAYCLKEKAAAASAAAKAAAPTATVTVDDDEKLLLTSGAAFVAATLQLGGVPGGAAAGADVVGGGSVVAAKRVLSLLEPFSDCLGDLYCTKVMCLLSLSCDPAATAFNAANISAAADGETSVEAAAIAQSLLMGEGVEGHLWHRLFFSSAEPLCVTLASSAAEALLGANAEDQDSRDRRSSAISNQLDLFASGTVFGDHGFSPRVFDPTGERAYLHAAQLLLLGYPEQAVAYLATHGQKASSSSSSAGHLCDAVHLALSLHYLGLLHSLPDDVALADFKEGTLPQLLGNNSHSAAPAVAVDVTLEPADDDHEGAGGDQQDKASNAGLLYYCTYRYKRQPSSAAAAFAVSSSSSNVSAWPDVGDAKAADGGADDEDDDQGATSATVFAIDLVGLVTAFLNHCMPGNPFAAADYLTLATYEADARQTELLATLLARSGAFASLAGPLAITNGSNNGGFVGLEANPMGGYLATHGGAMVMAATTSSAGLSSPPMRAEDSLARIILRAADIAHSTDGNPIDALSLYLRVPFYTASDDGDSEIGGLRPALSILIRHLSTLAAEPWWSSSASSSSAAGALAAASAAARRKAGAAAGAGRELFKRVSEAVYSLPMPQQQQGGSSSAADTSLQQQQRALAPLLHLCSAYEGLSKHDYQAALASIDSSQLLPMSLSLQSGAGATAGGAAGLSATASISSWSRVFESLPEALKQCYSTLLLAAAEALRGLSTSLERRAAMLAGGSIGGAALDAQTRTALRSLRDKCRSLHSPSYPESMRRYVDGTVLAALQRVEAEMPVY